MKSSRSEKQKGKIEKIKKERIRLKIKKRGIEDLPRNKLLELVKSVTDDRVTYNRVRKIKEKADLSDAVKYVIIDSLNKEYEKLKDKISELRKSNEDTFVIDMRILMIPQKIKLVKATYDEQDIEKVKEIFRTIKKEIEEIEKA
jgi:hypothetical protein